MARAGHRPRRATRLTTSGTGTPTAFFVAGHGGRYEIVIERRGARPVVIRRTAAPVALLPDESAEEKERITWQMRTDADRVGHGSGPEIPEAKAPLTGVTDNARTGNIWVRVAAPYRYGFPRTSWRRGARRARRCAITARRRCTRCSHPRAIPRARSVAAADDADPGRRRLRVGNHGGMRTTCRRSFASG
jgi:hypothetical protein